MNKRIRARETDNIGERLHGTLKDRASRPFRYDGPSLIELLEEKGIVTQEEYEKRI